MKPCKFKLESKTEHEDGRIDINMRVTGKGTENDEFFAQEPGGFFSLHGVKKEIGDEIVFNKEYLINIEEA